eukprot:scaffold3662_cov388-Prasinococcus_capsulatus_cf.AAC.1
MDCVGSVPYKVSGTLPVCLCIALLSACHPVAAAWPNYAQVTFDATWSAMSHPQAYVASAHWSPPVVAAHSDAYTMWELGGIATPGMESVAETGSTFSLTNELKAVQGSTVGDYSVAGSVGSGSGTTYTTVTATPAYSSISMVSMIAPSPDWIVGVSGIDMCDHETGLWKQAYSTYVYPVDAGTDNGLTLTAPNSDNTPHDPIAVLGQQFGPPEEVNPMGYVSIVADNACTGSQDYYVTLDGMWTNEYHPGAWIPEATFSPMVAAAHSADYDMWYLGGIATDGLEQVAESGMTSILGEELAALQGTSVGDYSMAEGPLAMGGVGSFSLK